jgi:hypothetical protein
MCRDGALNVVKVKQSHYRPGEALRVPGGWGSQISRQSAYEGGKVVSPTNGSPLPPRNYSWYSFLLEVESTPGPYCGRKDYVNKNIPVTPSGIEPATFRFVAQYLDQLRYRVSRPKCGLDRIIQYHFKCFSHSTIPRYTVWVTDVIVK